MRLTAADILDQGDASGRPRSRGSTLRVSINIRSEQDRRTSSCGARDYSVFLPAEINIEFEGDGDIGPSAPVNGIRGYGVLFVERENKLHMLHRSMVDALLLQLGIDIKEGHIRIANYMWHSTIVKWLPTPSTVSVVHEPGITGQQNHIWFIGQNIWHLESTYRFFSSENKTLQ